MAAQEALGRSVPPLALDAPITLRVSFVRALHADGASRVPGALRADGRTVEWRGENMEAVYQTFELMASLARDAAS